MKRIQWDRSECIVNYVVFVLFSKVCEKQYSPLIISDFYLIVVEYSLLRCSVVSLYRYGKISIMEK